MQVRRHVRLGAAVMGSDIIQVGKVDRLVIDRRTRQIVQLVARQGLILTKDRIVERDMANHVDAEGRVFLNLTSKEAEGLREYVVTDYVPRGHQSDFSWRGAIGTPLGGPLTTITDASTRYDNLAEQVIVVEKGMSVTARDGEKLGELEDVELDQDAVVTGLTISSGRFQKERRSFGVDQVAGVGVDYVRLTLTEAEAQAVTPNAGAD